jgi:hypothetical protein
VNTHGFLEHDEFVFILEAARRWWYAPEERDPECLFDLLFRPHAFVESLGEKRETDSQREAEQAAEDGGALRARADLRDALGGFSCLSTAERVALISAVCRSAEYFLNSSAYVVANRVAAPAEGSVTARSRTSASICADALDSARNLSGVIPETPAFATTSSASLRSRATFACVARNRVGSPNAELVETPVTAATMFVVLIRTCPLAS